MHIPTKKSVQFRGRERILILFLSFYCNLLYAYAHIHTHTHTHRHTNTWHAYPIYAKIKGLKA